MAKFVISKEGGRFYLKKYLADEGVDITLGVDMIYNKCRSMRNGNSVTLTARTSTPVASPVVAIRDARSLAGRMNGIVKDMTGIDALDGEPTGNKSMYRAMIAYRLHLLGYTWQISAGAVGRTVASVMRVSPVRFVSDDNPLWNKLLNVR